MGQKRIELSLFYECICLCSHWNKKDSIDATTYERKKTGGYLQEESFYRLRIQN